MRRLRSLALASTFVSAAGFGALACDRTWDFDCTAIWAEGPRQISKTVYTYEALATEQDATARCKKEMLENKPRDADAATCRCVGK